jgi:hypothetical protein
MGRWWQGGDEELASDYLVSRPKAQGKARALSGGFY